MAWIEIHQSLPAHPKLIRFAVSICEPPEQALGRLVKLWLWAIDYADDGDLSRFGAAEVAAACAWSKDPEILLKALQDARWLDGMVIHDWMDYAGRLVEARVANKNRMREKRAKNVQRTDCARTGATVPNRTQPTKPSPPLSPSGGIESEFEKARQAYPGHKRGFDPEWKNFKKKFGSRIAEILPLLLPAIAKYRATMERKSRQEGKPPFWANLSTWLNQERWTTEYPGEGVQKADNTFDAARVLREAEEKSQRDWDALSPEEQRRREAMIPGRL